MDVRRPEMKGVSRFQNICVRMVQGNANLAGEAVYELLAGMAVRLQRTAARLHSKQGGKQVVTAYSGENFRLGS